VLAPILAWTCSLSLPTTEDVAELMQAMRDRTNAHDSFVATYTVESPKRKGVLTLIYESPDRTCLRMQADDMNISTWLVGEQMSIRGNLAGNDSHADVDVGPFSEWERALDDEFPPRNIGAENLGPGPVIQVAFEPSSEGSSENSLAVRLSYHGRRTALLGWLANPISGRKRAGMQTDSCWNPPRMHRSRCPSRAGSCWRCASRASTAPSP